MISDGQVRLGKTCLGNRLQHQEAEFIYRILFVCRLTADRNVLVHRRSCRAERMCLASDFINRKCLDPQTCEKFQCFSSCNPFALQIIDEVRIHVLIKSSVAQ